MSTPLNSQETGHGAIFDGQRFLIFGGVARRNFMTPIEYCELHKNSLNETEIFCRQFQAYLNNYYMYPELVFVPDDFCQISL